MNAAIPFLLSKYTELVTSMLCEKYGFDEEYALRRFLFSESYRMLTNPELEMWEYPPEAILELWECEQISGNPRNAAFIREAQ